MSREEKRALNQHWHRRHHGSEPLDGTLIERLEQHELKHKTTPCDHVHEDYNYPASHQVIVGDLVKDA